MSASVRQYLIGIGASVSMLTAGVMVADREGLVTHTYIDAVDVYSSCYGHTGPELKLGQTFTHEQCLAQLAKDLVKTEQQLNSLTSPIKLTESERAAYVTFLYWAGAGNFATSTLRRKLLAGDHVGACWELTNACGKHGCNGWSYAGGKQLPGLVKAREKERDLCLSELELPKTDLSGL
ncbi:lysozyme [Shewanella sp. A32]|uniref:lysozyme n=1 Tax=Shewanella sp. A32 TaxID=3031327 RepID=UPI0023B983E3|nr:lysozyme [Shewanella sp. A32]MDF0535823.1 lysozyme [Shewanella sp. A32]